MELQTVGVSDTGIPAIRLVGYETTVLFLWQRLHLIRDWSMEQLSIKLTVAVNITYVAL